MTTTSKSVTCFTTVRVTYPHRFFAPEDQEWLSLLFARYTSLGFSVHYVPHDDETQILEWIFQEHIASHEVRSIYETASDIFDQPALLRFSAFDVSSLDDRDWLGHVYRANPPRHIGPFLVLDSDGAHDVNEEGLIRLDVTAATAFGSGSHGTTHGCLEHIGDLKAKNVQPVNILDIGTGSGILVIGAGLLWPNAALNATDNDPECLVVTARHIKRNHIRQDVSLILSEGFENDEMKARGPYDLILANILPAPLIHLADDVAQNCRSGGKVILSGIPELEAHRVETAYLSLGLTLENKKIVDSWASLCFAQP